MFVFMGFRSLQVLFKESHWVSVEILLISFGYGPYNMGTMVSINYSILYILNRSVDSNNSMMRRRCRRGKRPELEGMTSARITAAINTDA